MENSPPAKRAKRGSGGKVGDSLLTDDQLESREFLVVESVEIDAKGDYDKNGKRAVCCVPVQYLIEETADGDDIYFWPKISPKSKNAVKHTKIEECQVTKHVILDIHGQVHGELCSYCIIS